MFVATIASCTAGGGGGASDGGPLAKSPEQFVFESVVLPSGSYEIPDPETDDTISVPAGGGPSQDIQPNVPTKVALAFNAPQGNVVGIGIRFSPTGPVKVVPIPAAQGQSSGTLTSQMQLPQSVCGNLSSICHSIKCYEYAVTSIGKISKANITQVAIACGNCSEPSCQSLLQSCTLDASTDATDSSPEAGSCNSAQVQGSDTPETRMIEMGKPSGTFNFTWDMYTQKDQMTVSYGGTQLFDTGCVSGSGSRQITYSGTSTQVTISVKPNCAGGSGTSWTFTASCPQ
jgi:hypothetical protein